MGGLTNPVHLAFIAMIALIFLGPKRLPDLAKSLGSGMREFRETLSLGGDDDAPSPVLAAVEATPTAPAPAPAPAPVPEVAPPIAPVVPDAVAPPHAPDPS